MRYEIRVAGRLPRNWADWCDAFTATAGEAGETVLVGFLPDQAALMGLLNAVCQMNLKLIAVRVLSDREVVE